ncbi:MAG: SDR family NAD(P)-dependent oxidoreductase [Kineosporiaceae bacterium]
MTQRPTALVTGATAGIGREFARQLAAGGHDLVLVARDEGRLAEVAADLGGTHGVAVETVRADLTDRDDMRRVAARLADAARPVDVLVNNAGFGVNHFFVGGSLDEELRQLDVLCTAVLVLSHAAAPAMKARGRGAVITVSSVSAFTTQATYSAAKAWATAFSEVLAGELRGSGVVVTAVHPGFTRTEFHARAGMDMSRTPAAMWLDAERVVGDALRGARTGRRIVVPGRRYQAIAGLLEALPRGLRWRIFWARPGGRRTGSRR